MLSYSEIMDMMDMMKYGKKLIKSWNRENERSKVPTIQENNRIFVYKTYCSVNRKKPILNRKILQR